MRRKTVKKQKKGGEGTPPDSPIPVKSNKKRSIKTTTRNYYSPKKSTGNKIRFSDSNDIQEFSKESPEPDPEQLEFLDLAKNELEQYESSYDKISEELDNAKNERDKLFDEYISILTDTTKKEHKKYLDNKIAALNRHKTVLEYKKDEMEKKIIRKMRETQAALENPKVYMKKIKQSKMQVNRYESNRTKQELRDMSDSEVSPSIRNMRRNIKTLHPTSDELILKPTI
jgi:C-terminal processing protease CtpA/Prc